MFVKIKHHHYSDGTAYSFCQGEPVSFNAIGGGGHP